MGTGSARPYGPGMLTTVPINELTTRAGTEPGVTDGVRISQEMLAGFSLAEVA
jgi:hypothetical protein